MPEDHRMNPVHEEEADRIRVENGEGDPHHDRELKPYPQRVSVRGIRDSDFRSVIGRTIAPANGG